MNPQSSRRIRRAPELERDSPSADVDDRVGWSARELARATLASGLARDPSAWWSAWLAAEGRDLEELVGAARRVHGPFGDHSDFAFHVAAIAAGRFLDELDGADARAALARPIRDFLPPHAGDLHLGWACTRTPPDDRAWRVLWRHGSGPLLRLARSFGARNPNVVVADFLADVWVPRDGGPSLLSTYRGLAALRSWLWLVFRRRAAREQRTAARASWISIASSVEHVSDDPEPEQRELDSHVHAVIASLLARLSDRDRDLVVSLVCRGERGASAARRHKVSASYVSRRTREVLARLRPRMIAELRRLGYDRGGAQ